MLKKILILFLVVVISGIGAYFYFFQTKRSMIRPYPYAISDYKVDNVDLAENAKILLIGDQMAIALYKHIGDLEKIIQLPVFNWASPHEGLHRTLYKLKLLKHFPKIIIYHGASEELYEKKFNIADKEKIEQNFAMFDNDKIISLIITFPILSKYFYKKIHYVDLTKIEENNEINSAEDKLNIKQLSFQIFNQELRELIDLAKRNKSKLIFITTPLNNNIPPKEVCAHANTPTIQIVQSDIQKLIDEGKFKEAFSAAKNLSDITTANALSFYLLGVSARGLGNQKTAREAFQKAAVFDCKNWRGNAVYNSILTKEGQKNQILVIDFDRVLDSNESADALFFDEIIPQNIYYNGLVKELGEAINIISSVFK